MAPPPLILEHPLRFWPSSRRHDACVWPNVMPTLEHSALIEMFRENPELAVHILATVFHRDVPPHASVRVADSGLDQLIPVEFRADMVLEHLDDAGRVILAIVLEVQREKKPRKKYTWAVYWAVARAERECPAVVLVVAPDGEVAAWAGETIDLGLGLGTLQPLVLGPATLPELTDPTDAAKEIELAVLSAMAHGNGPHGLAVVQAAFLALGRLDREHEAVYFRIIWNLLREPMQRALEAMAMEQQTEGKETLPRSRSSSSSAASAKASATPCCGCSRAQGSRPPRTNARASWRARTWRCSTGGWTTSWERRLRPTSSPDAAQPAAAADGAPRLASLDTVPRGTPANRWAGGVCAKAGRAGWVSTAVAIVGCNHDVDGAATRGSAPRSGTVRGACEQGAES